MNDVRGQNCRDMRIQGASDLLIIPILSEVLKEKRDVKINKEEE